MTERAKDKERRARKGASPARKARRHSHESGNLGYNMKTKKNRLDPRIREDDEKARMTKR